MEIMANFDQTAEAQLEANGGDLDEQGMFALLMGAGGVAGDTSGTLDTVVPPTDAKEPPTEDADAKKDIPKEPAKDDQPAATDEPEGPKVVLAKDGVHTIDYQKLVDARESAKTAAARAAAAEAEAQRLRDELAAARATQAPAPAPAGAPAPAAETGETVDDGELFGDYSSEAMKKGVETLIGKHLASFKSTVDSALAPVQKTAAEDALTKHYTEIYTAHPDADSIMESDEFGAWRKSQPRLVAAAFEQALTGGTAADVVDVFNAYRSARPKVAAPAQAAAAVADKAKAAIAAVKPRTPTTLSDIPAGAMAHSDENAALAEMDPLALMNKFGDMSPKQIEALLARTL